MPLLSWSEYRSNSTTKQSIECEKNNLKEILDNHPIEQVALLSRSTPAMPLVELFNHQCQVTFVQQDNTDCFRRQIMRQQLGEYACMFCNQTEPNAYCKHFNGKPEGKNVCKAFEASDNPYLQCRAFQQGKNIQFHQNDSTCGVTNRFIKKAADLVTRSRNPVDALSQAIDLVNKFAQMPVSQIKLEDHSVDLVISNLMLSDFESEPYNYFVSLMEDRFGKARLDHLAEVTHNLFQRLQDKLFDTQAMHHFKEIFRIANKDFGQVFFCMGPIMDRYHSTHFSMQHLDSPFVFTEHFTESLRSA